MTTFSFLSHSKRLPRTGAVDFDIERCRAAPSGEERSGDGPSPNDPRSRGTLLAGVRCHDRAPIGVNCQCGALRAPIRAPRKAV